MRIMQRFQSVSSSRHWRCTAMSGLHTTFWCEHSMPVLSPPCKGVHKRLKLMLLLSLQAMGRVQRKIASRVQLPDPRIAASAGASTSGRFTKCHR